jgi:hypothetical protein
MLHIFVPDLFSQGIDRGYRSALFLTVLRRWTILLRELVVPPGLTPKVVVELEVD